MREKIGILTFHRARNIGACLQAYALQTYLESQGQKVEIINYCPQYIEDSFGIFPKDLYRKAKKEKKLPMWLIKSLIKFPFVIIREKKFKDFRQKFFNLSGEKIKKQSELKNLADKYRAVFLGSDQIWNPLLTKGGDLSYFGEFLDERTVIASYAASIGISALNNQQKKVMQRGISNLDYVGVREKNAKEMIKEILDVPVDVNMDPTFLLSHDEWENITPILKVQYKYVLVYALEINETLIKLAKEISEKKGLEIIFFDMKNYYGKNAHSKYTTSPDEFLSYVKNAEYVVTNSFHGTVFSIMFEKQFISVAHKSRNSRIQGILSELGLESRLVTDGTRKMEELERIVYSNEIKKKLENRISLSKEYIAKVLKEGK